MNQEESNLSTSLSANDDFNLKAMILKGLEYFWLLWGKKWWILLIALLGGGAMYLRDYWKPINYQATFTFTLNEGEGPSGAGLSGLLGQIGLASSSSGKVSLDKIVELSRSMRIVNKALFEKGRINDKDDYLANHIIEVYKMDKDWAKYDPSLQGFRFKNDHIDSFNLKEKSILKAVYGSVVGGMKPGLVSCVYDNKSTIFSLSATTLDEGLSIALTEKLFTHLSDFYVRQSNDKQKLTYDLIKYKVDSLYRVWTGMEYAVSQSEQSGNALWSMVDRTGRNIQGKKAVIASMAYGEALKNLEMADYALKNATPFIREIDRPFSPLYPMMPNKIRDIIIGLILGGVLACVFFLGKNIILQALQT
ncbi:MAG: hypothetical protein ABI844_07465 [Saprospiraceae bacterium]